MTKQEVIKILHLIKSTVFLGNRKFLDAIDRAIELLKQPEPCDDAVSRKAVEEMLKNGFPARGTWEIEGDVVKQTVCETLADALMDLERLPPVTPKPEPQWVSCNKKLPDAEYGESPTVYCYCYDFEHGGKWAEMLYFNGGVWCKPTGETFDYKVLAWYPLPKKPYREEGGE